MTPAELAEAFWYGIDPHLRQLASPALEGREARVVPLAQLLTALEPWVALRDDGKSAKGKAPKGAALVAAVAPEPSQSVAPRAPDPVVGTALVARGLSGGRRSLWGMDRLQARAEPVRCFRCGLANHVASDCLVLPEGHEAREVDPAHMRSARDGADGPGKGRAGRQ